MASGVGGAGGSNRVPNFPQKPTDRSEQKGRLGEHEITQAGGEDLGGRESPSVAQRRGELEGKIPVRRPSDASSSGSSKSNSKGLLGRIWSGVKNLFKGKGSYTLPTVSSPKNKMPGAVRLKEFDAGKADAQKRAAEEANAAEVQENSEGEEETAGPSGMGKAKEALASGARKLQSAARGAKGKLGEAAEKGRAGMKGLRTAVQDFGDRIRRGFSSSDSSSVSSASKSSASARDLFDIRDLTPTEPAGPSTKLTKQELLETREKLTGILNDGNSFPEDIAFAEKYLSLVDKDLSALESGEAGAAEEFDPELASNEELGKAMDSGRGAEEEVKELRDALEGLTGSLGAEGAESEYSTRLEVGDRPGRLQRSVQAVKNLLTSFLKLITGFFRRIYARLQKARRAAAEWIRRNCSCIRGRYDTSRLDPEGKVARWLKEHYRRPGSGDGGSDGGGGIPESVVEDLSEQNPFQREDGGLNRQGAIRRGVGNANPGFEDEEQLLETASLVASLESDLENSKGGGPLTEVELDQLFIGVSNALSDFERRLKRQND